MSIEVSILKLMFAEVKKKKYDYQCFYSVDNFMLLILKCDRC